MVHLYTLGGLMHEKAPKGGLEQGDLLGRHPCILLGHALFGDHLPPGCLQDLYDEEDWFCMAPLQQRAPRAFLCLLRYM